MKSKPVDAIRIKNACKSFGSVLANDCVCLSVRNGEILALLGENGSGKTTLVNMLSGIYFPDSGSIEVNGKEVTIRSPKDAFDLGIGMIHQHFKLVDVLTAAENIVLGLPGSLRIDRSALNAEIRAISKRYGLEVEPEKMIYDMSVSEKQTVEILKVLYRGASILILDEPTAVLTPQETDKLFNILRNMKKDGKAIIIITHKLNEVLSISDRVSILRKGRLIDTVETSTTNAQELTEMMVGRFVSLAIDRAPCADTEQRLRLRSVTCRNADGVKALNNVSFTLMAGEILGVAGIAGSGQKELCEVISGLHPIEEGKISLVLRDREEKISGLSPSEIANRGVSLAFVPEDRLGMGLVASMDMVDNMMLKSYKDPPGFFVDRKPPKEMAERLIRRLEIVTPGTSTPVRRLSGGNVQKVLLGREIASNPSVLIAAYPVRGLDINSSYTVYDLLNEQKQKGVAVLYIGEDLDVLLELCDRILVLCGGRVSGIVDARSTSKEEIGMMMVHIDEEKEVGA
ncbi:MAG: Galactose/methyl galactoside import ATP-binding protein MglA [Firmicutes bacterium ADurb.Bin182]|nr:MAG: Galactose/methyl galactoside import ATP-binding protein MglA [Firmicutes bacterium ADurb.Bin182]